MIATSQGMYRLLVLTLLGHKHYAQTPLSTTATPANATTRMLHCVAENITTDELFPKNLAQTGKCVTTQRCLSPYKSTLRCTGAFNFKPQSEDGWDINGVVKECTATRVMKGFKLYVESSGCPTKRLKEKCLPVGSCKLSYGLRLDKPESLASDYLLELGVATCFSGIILILAGIINLVFLRSPY